MCVYNFTNSNFKEYITVRKEGIYKGAEQSCVSPELRNLQSFLKGTEGGGMIPCVTDKEERMNGNKGNLYPSLPLSKAPIQLLMHPLDLLSKPLVFTWEKRDIFL